MTVENIRSLLETKTSEEIAKEFSDNLNKAIQMKAEEETKAREENERLLQRLLVLEDIMELIDEYLYLSDYKYPNEEELNLREVDKLIQDFLAMTETVENNGWLSFFKGHPTTGLCTKDNTIEKKDNTSPFVRDIGPLDPTSPIDPLANKETPKDPAAMTWEEFVNFLFDPYIENESIEKEKTVDSFS